MKRKTITLMLTLLLLTTLCCTSSLAAGGDVAGAIESTWKTAAEQIKMVVNNVVFPAIDMILAVFFFVKLGTSYFEFRKHGQFEWAGPCDPFRLPCLYPDRTAVRLDDHRHLNSQMDATYAERS